MGSRWRDGGSPRRVSYYSIQQSIKPLTRDRFREIIVGIEEEARDKSGVTWRELVLVPVNRHRVIIIICLQIGMPNFDGALFRALKMLTSSRCATHWQHFYGLL